MSSAANRKLPPAARRAPAPRRSNPVQIRRRRVVALIAGLLLLSALGVGARVLVSESGLFDVDTVTVTGATTIPVADVLSAAAVPPGQPLADLDTAGVAQRVAALPPVAFVHVGRSWPHTVTIEVTERVPLAVFATVRGDELVDGTGVVYAGPAVAELPRMTLSFVGPEDQSTKAALTALAALPAVVRTQVRTIDARTGAPGAPSQVSFGLTEDRQVRWGDPDRGQEKAAVLVPLLTRPGRVYDVASPDLATVRR